MNTPIYDFVQNYIGKNPVRAHMPGHKGYCPDNCGFSCAYAYDITEIAGADALFEADGIIAQSEANAAKLFGTAKTLYSAGGSTLCIPAMLALACKSGDTVVAVRNAHRAFINACVLLDLDVEWVYPVYENGSVISGTVSPESIEAAVLSAGSPACVYITSPDYLGRTADIKAISDICKKHSVPLIVDNAHGAHLAFLEENIHPIALGADMCCDSAHKTLPVLTGGAYLHIGSEKYSARAKDCMALFASTSPSYLILQSLDLCNAYLDRYFKQALADTARKINLLKEKLLDVYTICKSEPLKLTVYTLPNGLYGFELADILRKNGIECEYADNTHVVMMLSPFSTNHDFDRIYQALIGITAFKPAIPAPPADFPIMKKAMSLRSAALAESEAVPIEKSIGRICSKTATVCPPCIAAAVSGEIISPECINIFKRYSISIVNVVKCI
jgi:arginine/lysine/ornithine decarboxylase